MSFRKQKTLALRRALQVAALDLFERLSYREVTVQQIAEQAGVSESTVYRHFRTKEQLILWDEADSAIEKHFIKNLGKGTPFESLRRAFVGAYAALPPEALALLARRSQFIDSVPEVFAAMALGLESDRGELQEALISVYNRPPLQMELVVRFALASLVTGLESWIDAGAGEDLAQRIDEAFAAAPDALA